MVKFGEIFRTHLNENVDPVTYPTFRDYMVQVLDDIDPDKPSQEMIVAQFITEAKEGREAFRLASLASASDAPWMPAFQEDATIFGPGAAAPGRGLLHIPPAAMPSWPEELPEEQTYSAP